MSEDILELPNQSKKHDVFLSHASEDKDEFVREFYNELTKCGINVFYDEDSIQWGDSISSKIDKALSSSKYFVLVLSVDFLQKNWTQYEQQGAIAQSIAGNGRILPIWHKVTMDDILTHSPSLADKLALNTSTHSIDDMVVELQNIITQSGHDINDDISSSSSLIVFIPSL